MGSKDLGYQILKNEYLKFLKKRESKGNKLIDKIDKLNKFYLPVCSWITGCNKTRPTIFA